MERLEHNANPRAAEAGERILAQAVEAEAIYLDRAFVGPLEAHPHPSPGLLVSLRVQAGRVKGSPYLARAFAKRGADLGVEAPGQAQRSR